MERPADLSLTQVKKYLDRRVAELALLFNFLEKEDSSALREVLHRWKGNAELYGFGELGILSGNTVTLLDRSPIQWDRISNGIDSISEMIHRESKELLELIAAE